MTFIYYCAADAAVYFLPARTEDHGVLIGSISQLPKQPGFLVQSLLTNAGYHGVTGLSLVHGPRKPDNQEPVK